MINRTYFVSLLLISSILCNYLSYADQLIELNQSNWEAEVAKGRIFVKFYAPWCGFCKKIAPTWDQLAEDAVLKEKGIRVGKIDCTMSGHDPLCKSFGVTGFPTLKLLENGNEVKYEGERTLEKMRDFAVSTTPSTKSAIYAPKAQPISWSPDSGMIEVTLDNIKDIKTGDWVLVFYADWCGNCLKMSKIYDSIAEHYKGSNLNIARINVDSRAGGLVKRLFTVEEVPTFKIIKGGSMYNMTYESQSGEQIVHFIEKRYINEKANPIPIIPDIKVPTASKSKEGAQVAQPSETTLPNFVDIPSYFNKQEAFMGISACFVIFFLGFTIGRLTASSTPVVTAPKKVQ